MARGFLLRSAAYVLLAAIAVATGVQLVMSAIQAANKPADTSTNNQLIPLTGDLTSDNACQTSVLNQSRPLEVIVMDKNTGKNSTLYCGWPSGNEAVRLPTAVVSLVLAVCVLVFGMWKRKRWVMWIAVLLGGAVAFGFFLAMCIDANSVRTASEWCEEQEAKNGWTCYYAPFITLVLLDAGLCVAWTTLAVVGYMLARYHMDRDAHGKFVVEHHHHYAHDESVESLVDNQAPEPVSKPAPSRPNGGGDGGGGLLTSHRTAGADSYEAVLQRQFEQARQRTEQERDQYTL